MLGGVCVREREGRREGREEEKQSDREAETCFVAQACPELIMLSRLAPSCCSLWSAGITGMCHRPPQVFNSQAQVNATETWQISLSHELSKILSFLLNFMWVGVFPACMSVQHVCPVSEELRSPRTGVSGSYELPCGFLEFNQVPLEEQPVLF